MRLTVLGNAAAYPGPGGACSGYLIEDDNIKLLLDCGTGVLANLQKYIPLNQLSHIIISHMHADHFLDLIPMRYALMRLKMLGIEHRPTIHLPPAGALTLLNSVSFLNNMAFFSEYFEVKEYKPDSGIAISAVKIKFTQVPHYVPAYAIAIITREHKLTYSADCAPSEALAELAAKSDLFLCEAPLEAAEKDAPTPGHMTIAQAAAIAKKAGASRLLLTHLWPETDYSSQLNEAKRRFSGAIEIAEVNKSYLI